MSIDVTITQTDEGAFQVRIPKLTLSNFSELEPYGEEENIPVFITLNEVIRGFQGMCAVASFRPRLVSLQAESVHSRHTPSFQHIELTVAIEVADYADALEASRKLAEMFRDAVFSTRAEKKKFQLARAN
jgi:hypothetical protein